MKSAPETLEDAVVAALRTVYDPEIPVNIYDLGLVYAVDASEDGKVFITMTLTAPACPVAGILPGQVEAAVRDVEGVTGVSVELTFDPPWDQARISPEALLKLGLL